MLMILRFCCPPCTLAQLQHTLPPRCAFLCLISCVLFFFCTLSSSFPSCPAGCRYRARELLLDRWRPPATTATLRRVLKVCSLLLLSREENDLRRGLDTLRCLKDLCGKLQSRVETVEVDCQRVI